MTANLNELTAFKARLMRAFCMSEGISALLQNDGENAMTGRALMYERVFPYAYVPNTTQIARSFLCFKCEVPNVQNDVIKEIVITIYAIAHQSVMRLEGGEGMRINALSAQVDEILNGARGFGLGTLTLMSVREYSVGEGYHVNELKYSAMDINRSPCGE